ncbi:spore maturation protein CgeB [Lachnospiraceae bacterium XBB2008]|nr:spore maturation protein CgeB [Lachnospiraceae bacterium XBB2008]
MVAGIIVLDANKIQSRISAMKILYYYWGENSKEDCIECMEALGYKVSVFAMHMKNYVSDPHFIEAINAKLKEGFDCLFSFDYFPLLSEVAMDSGLPYISWVYDSPHYTLESVTLNNPCNHVYLFDYGLTEQYRNEGCNTVEYMPLACNTKRLDRICSPIISSSSYKHEVTFLGNLYNDENNFYDQINYLPAYLKGYFDAIIASQSHVYGYDLSAQLINDEISAETARYVQADLGGGFRSARNEILRNMLRKKVTVNERHDLIKRLGDNFSVDLYAPVKPTADIHVSFKGYADYRDQMPIIFASSKININITLRSILTGIPLRIVDILGAGGFVLSNYQAEFAEYFAYGESIVWFDSPEDLIEKCAYFLVHDEERETIARRGHDIAVKAFDYAVLLPRIFI